MSNVDPKDTQPFRNSPEVNHRLYIPATWNPTPGTGHPKLSGGVSIDKRTGQVCGNGLNRPDQRYIQPQTTVQANRVARANAEYPNTVVLIGEAGHYEVRTQTGNNYDVSGDLTKCDCPDWLKIDLSGYGIIRCKHIYLVMIANADPFLPFGVQWSTEKWAEVAGSSVRTAQALCQSGFIPAYKIHNVWIIDPDVGQISADDWIAKCIDDPVTWGEL